MGGGHFATPALLGDANAATAPVHTFNYISGIAAVINQLN